MAQGDLEGVRCGHWGSNPQPFICQTNIRIDGLSCNLSSLVLRHRMGFCPGSMAPSTPPGDQQLWRLWRNHVTDRPLIDWCFLKGFIGLLPVVGY
ncbi:unnamed protein product [Boreogadus saida]